MLKNLAGQMQSTAGFQNFTYFLGAGHNPQGIVGKTILDPTKYFFRYHTLLFRGIVFAAAAAIAHLREQLEMSAVA